MILFKSLNDQKDNIFCNEFHTYGFTKAYEIFGDIDLTVFTV